MKNIFALMLLIMMYLSSKAQVASTSFFDSLSYEQFFRKINSEFSSVVNSGGISSIGNFASADIKDGKLNFNASGNFTQGDIWSFSANGVITDGIYSIFSNTKLNSSVGLNFKYHLSLKRASLSYNTSELHTLRNKMAVTQRKGSLLMHKHIKDSSEVWTKYQRLRNDSLNIQRELTGTRVPESRKQVLEGQQIINNKQLDSVWIEILNVSSYRQAVRSVYQIKTGENNKSLDEFKLNGFSFHWLSLGAGIQNNNFSHFISEYQNLDSQVSKQNYATWFGSIDYNYYHWNKYNCPTWYFQLGVKGGQTDNFSSLNKLNITDIQLYGDSLKQRKIVKDFNAYKGDYNKELTFLDVNIHTYLFVYKSTFAIHFYPYFNFKENHRPRYNVGFGILYSFLKAEEKRDDTNPDKLNTELYFQLSDLDSPDGESILKRSELGLRFSFPINFTKNKS